MHPLLDKYDGEPAVAGSSGQFLDHFEGDWKEGARFTQFRYPLMQAFQRFWQSAEHESIKQLCTDVIPPSFTCPVEGLDPDEWAEGTRGTPSVKSGSKNRSEAPRSSHQRYGGTLRRLRVL